MKAFLKCIFWYLKNNSTGRVSIPFLLRGESQNPKAIPSPS